MLQFKSFQAADSTKYDRYFLANSQDSLTAYQEAIAIAQKALIEAFTNQTQPYSGANLTEIANALVAIELCPEVEQELRIVLDYTRKIILNNSAIVSHPNCIAHLHCPPLLPALAAELLISATNQSMDSWDQSPAATLLEQQVVNWLCQLFGYSSSGDGVFTSGGTQSNFMGLLLARNAVARDRLDWSVQQQGLPPEHQRYCILCSTVSHFTIRQAAALMGLGEQAVVMVETDENYCLRAAAVERKLAQLQQKDRIPIALVATAGTTDFGSIDSLPELARCATRHGLWLHVDAAYGGALMLSDRYKYQLNGIEAADSITVDFHKLFYQPISCGAFLVKQRSHFDSIELHADYLNPETNADAGIPDLVTKSVQTTRRFDALKLFVSLQTLGRRQLGEMIDSTIELAKETANLIDARSALELANRPTINAVVFRYRPTQTPKAIDAETWADRVNYHIRITLLQQGFAVLAQTKIGNLTYLKFTLLNPRTTLADIAAILDRIDRIGKEWETEQISRFQELIG